jgi:hypothetical protein
MPNKTMLMNDPEFWGNCPKELEPLVHGGGGDQGLAYFLLGDPKDNPPTGVAFRMGPGWVRPRHSHDCYRSEIVLQGSLDVGDQILRPGDIQFSEPGVAYGPQIAGPEGCTTFETFSNYQGSYVMFLHTSEGRVECDLSTPEGRQRMLEAMREAAQTVKRS